MVSKTQRHVCNWSSDMPASMSAAICMTRACGNSAGDRSTCVPNVFVGSSPLFSATVMVHSSGGRFRVGVVRNSVQMSISIASLRGTALDGVALRLAAKRFWLDLYLFVFWIAI